MVPASRISALSSGDFVGMVADDPDNKIELKLFHSEIQNDHEAIKKEMEAYQTIPNARQVSDDEISAAYEQIKQDVRDLIANELEPLLTRQRVIEAQREEVKTRTSAAAGGGLDYVKK